MKNKKKNIGKKNNKKKLIKKSDKKMYKHFKKIYPVVIFILQVVYYIKKIIFK